MAPVVERRHRADDVQHRVRQPGLVVADVGQVLDLAHDVEAEVADHAADERGQARVLR